MKKTKLLILILTGISCFGQDSVIDSVSQNYTGQYVQEYETPYGDDRPKTEIYNRELSDDFKEDYKGEQFDYDRIVKEKEVKMNPPMFQIPAGLLQFLMYAVLGLILILVIFFIIKNAGGLSFGKEKRNISYDSSDETGEEDLEEIGNNNFEKLIQKAKSEEDYRKAVRYYYLWVLQKLTDRDLIKWHKEKTDFDYLQELKNNAIKEDFSANTYIYDYTWYGNFNLNSKEFEMAETIFQRTLKKII